MVVQIDTPGILQREAIRSSLVDQRILELNFVDWTLVFAEIGDPSHRQLYLPVAVFQHMVRGLSLCLHHFLLERRIVLGLAGGTAGGLDAVEAGIFQPGGRGHWGRGWLGCCHPLYRLHAVIPVRNFGEWLWKRNLTQFTHHFMGFEGLWFSSLEGDGDCLACLGPDVPGAGYEHQRGHTGRPLKLHGTGLGQVSEPEGDLPALANSQGTKLDISSSISCKS